MESKIQELTNELSHTQGIIRAQELIDESKSAQLIIQHIELGKLKQPVHAKEGGKEERFILLKGKGLG